MSGLYPLRLAPSWREKIWGSTDLAPLFGPQPRRVGEVWYTFEENTITNGPCSGRTLAELMQEYVAALMGAEFRPSRLQRRSAGDAARRPAAGAYFPILVKFLFTSAKLSVQVHPDDEYALRHEGGPGKTEVWYVLKAEPGASIALGLTAPLTREQLRQAACSGQIVKYLNWVPVKAGDALFSPPGTLHSIGEGLALCEVQQNSDLTYRLYDFGRLGDDGRPRGLHIEQAVEVTRTASCGGIQQPAPVERAGIPCELLASCKYFAVERLSPAAAFDYLPDPRRMHLLIFLEGRGALAAEPYQPGDVYLIPSAMGAFAWRPAERTAALRAYVPAA